MSMDKNPEGDGLVIELCIVRWPKVGQKHIIYCLTHSLEHGKLNTFKIGGNVILAKENKNNQT